MLHEACNEAGVPPHLPDTGLVIGRCGAVNIGRVDRHTGTTPEGDMRVRRARPTPDTHLGACRNDEDAEQVDGPTVRLRAGSDRTRRLPGRAQPRTANLGRVQERKGSRGNVLVGALRGSA